MTAMLTSLRQAAPVGQTTQAVVFDPRFEYLRITRGRHTGWMWLGSTEKSTAGPIEVYYSGQGEVLRLQNGRVVGASGLTTEWRKVTIESPRWGTAATAPTAKVTRVRDVMPGYRAGIRDELVLRPVPTPASSALRGVEPGSLKWFEEVPGRLADSAEALPAARYAVDLAAGERVIYAEQCLARDLCFTWQRWSAAMQAAASAPLTSQR
jgi:hypothetical protein